MIVVVKIGTSSVVDDETGGADEVALGRLSLEIAELRRQGHGVVLVTSGAIATGQGLVGRDAVRPGDAAGLRALSSVGQHRLMRAYDDAFATNALLAGQVLLAPLDFAERSRYLNARQTLQRLIELGVVPVVNENDTISDDEIRFGDNDRLAALVAHLMRAELLVLLTDLAGLFSADPKIDEKATLIEEVREIDRVLEEAAGPSLSTTARGGMASKLQAAKIAAWSGVRTLIAAADRPSVLTDAVSGKQGVGTLFLPHERRLTARKLWIAFALRPAGRLLVDAGAKKAVVEHSTSLLSAGVTAVEGPFSSGEAVELAGPDGVVFAKGIVSLPSVRSGEWLGKRTAELPDELSSEVVHRDDLVVLEALSSREGAASHGSFEDGPPDLP